MPKRLGGLTALGLAMACIQVTARGAPPSHAGQYWTEFAQGHTTEAPIDALLSDVNGLWDGELGELEVTLSWNGEAIEGTSADSGLIVLNDRDESNRPTFEVFSGSGLTLATGFVDVDEENGWVVIEIVHANGEAHRYAGPDLGPSNSESGEEGGGEPQEIIMCATCVCFGLPGGTTNACTNTQCDEGESCGTDGGGNNKACRWSAAQGSKCDGGVISTPVMSQVEVIPTPGDKK